MGKSIHGMRARSRDRARAHHNGRVSSRLFLAGCSPAEPASASPADATLRLHPPQCQRNFIEPYFVTVLVVSAQGSTAIGVFCRILLCLFLPVVSYFCTLHQEHRAGCRGTASHQKPLALLVNGHSSGLARCQVISTTLHKSQEPAR